MTWKYKKTYNKHIKEVTNELFKKQYWVKK